MNNYEGLLKQLQNGFSGPTALDQCHMAMAEAFNAIQELQNEVERLQASQYKTRTEKQSSSRWLYLEALAVALNDSGIDQVQMLKTLRKAPSVEIPNTKEGLYETYWTPIRKAMIKNGTIRPVKRPNTKEIHLIYETMNRHTANTFGISLPWPDVWSQSNEH